MIGIGSEMGGPELKGSAIRSAVFLAMNAAADASKEGFDDGTSSWINPIFFVPGSIVQPNFEGFRVAHYSAKRKVAVVHIAVPERVKHSDNVNQDIFDLLKEATIVASKAFATKKVAFDQAECDRVLTAVGERMGVDADRAAGVFRQ